VPLLGKMTDIDFILRRGVSEIIPEKEFVDRLNEGPPLRLKMGFDPSKPDIHLGHVVGLRKLRQLQDIGHKVILIVGDWTAQIGDPSGRSATRPMISREEVVENAKTYTAQFFKVVDRARTDVVWQSEWFGKFGLEDVIKLASVFTTAQILAREDFSVRYAQGHPISMSELMYPLLQAYDSVAIQADVEFGGTDQKFNVLAGRQLQQSWGYSPQICFFVPVIPGTDGFVKMSKSLDNYIGIDESPVDMYGKIMSIPDHLVWMYLEVLTDVSESDLVKMKVAVEGNHLNPLEVKKTLAKQLVNTFHGFDASEQATENFENVYQRRNAPEEIPCIEIKSESGIINVVLTRFLLEYDLVDSRSEAKRLLTQGGIQVNGQKIESDECVLEAGSVLKIGRHKWARIVVVDP
jgi:tyrosyl-tRNA synthetase